VGVRGAYRAAGRAPTSQQTGEVPTEPSDFADDSAIPLAGTFGCTTPPMIKPPPYFVITPASLITLVVLAHVWLLLPRTVISRRPHPVGRNADASRLSGISVPRYRIGAFVAYGTAAAFVRLTFAGKYESINPQALLVEELAVLTAAAILGGTSLFGGVRGQRGEGRCRALILAALANGMKFQQINSACQGVIEGAGPLIAAAGYVCGGTPQLGHLPGREADARASRPSMVTQLARVDRRQRTRHRGCA